MKKKIIYLLAMAMMAVPSFSLMSCGDDDETEVVRNDENDDNDKDDGKDDDSESSRTECRYCNGSGECPGSNCNNGKCTRCGGKGYTYSGNYKTTCPWCERGKCPACHGNGRCPKCNGRGYM